MTSLFLLSLPSSGVPGTLGEPETRLKNWLDEKIGTQHGVSSIALPDLKIGLLDNLVQQAEEVAKLDSQLQNVLTKTHEAIVSIFASDEAKISAAEQVDGRPPWQYLQQFGWNTARYRPDKPVSALLDTLSTEALSAEQDLRNQTSQYTSAKQQVQALDRKFSGDLSVRTLDSVVRPTDIVQNSEFLESVLIVVPLNGERDFLGRYESLSQMVVPRSAKKVSADSTYVLYSVTVFRKFASEFEAKAREAKWIPRDLPEAHSSSAATVEAAEQARKAESEARANERKLRTSLERLAAVTFSDIVKAWGHIKVIRVFVESVLRYGLPLNYVTASFVPAHSPDKAEARLIEEFAFLGGNAVARDSRGRFQTTDSADIAEYAALVEQDYRPFVIYVSNLP